MWNLGYKADFRKYLKIITEYFNVCLRPFYNEDVGLGIVTDMFLLVTFSSSSNCSKDLRYPTILEDYEAYPISKKKAFGIC
jgi:hypothetical protein